MTLLRCVSTGIVLQLTKPPFTVVSNHLPRPPPRVTVTASDSGWGPFKWLEATACAPGPRDSARYFGLCQITRSNHLCFITHTLCISRNGSGLGIFFSTISHIFFNCVYESLCLKRAIERDKSWVWRGACCFIFMPLWWSMKPCP